MYILRWLIFNVLIALTPLAFELIVLSSKTHSQGKSLIFMRVLGGGELFLVATALSAEAIGDLIGAGSERMGLKLISAGGCLLTLMLSVFFYGVNAISQPEDFPVLYPSLILYGLTLVAACSCKILARLEGGHG